MIEKIKSFFDGHEIFSFISWSAVIAISIAGVFWKLPHGNQLEMKDYFNFAGVFGGAIFGGFISFLILKKNLEKQEEQFSKERKLDVHLKAIDETIKRYEVIFDLLKEIKKNLNRAKIMYVRYLNWDYEKNEEALIEIEENELEIKFKLSVLNDLDNKDIIEVIKEIKWLYKEFEEKGIGSEEFANRVKSINKKIDSIIKSKIIDEIHRLNRSKFEISNRN